MFQKKCFKHAARSGRKWEASYKDPMRWQREHSAGSVYRIASYHIAAEAEMGEPVAECDSESLSSAPPDPDAANLAGCSQDEEEDAEELRRRSAKAALAAMKELKRKRMPFARQAEASILAACISVRKRKKREADEQAELAEQLGRQRMLLAGAAIRVATFSSLQRFIVAQDGRADLYRAELQPGRSRARRGARTGGANRSRQCARSVREDCARRAGG
jgi:hypothetical protein